ncbi:MAG: hypothetical protein U1E56_01895 [Bauldia sp.]
MTDTAARSPKHSLAAAVLAAGLALPALPAGAMDFAAKVNEDGIAYVTAEGVIQYGDVYRLEDTVSAAERTGKAVSAIVVDSPGGRGVAAASMADFILKRHLPVVVPARAMCASACFLMFAAGEARVTAPSARVGVHSAALTPGGDAEEFGTALMRWYLESLRVPAAILDKMVATAPKDISWLTDDDLQSMGGTITRDWAAAPAVKLAAAAPAKAATTSTLAQTAALTLAPQATGNAKPMTGTVTWEVADGGTEGPEIHGLAELGNGSLRVQLVLRKNTEKALGARAIVEVAVSATAKEVGGGIVAIAQPMVRNKEAATAEPLVGLARKVIDDLFWVSLSDEDKDAVTNLENLKGSAFFELPLTYKSGEKAVLSLAKGAPGMAAFEAALAAWGR